MAKSPQEFRAMVDAIGDPEFQSHKKVTFLHFACCYFLKKWPHLFDNNADPNEVEKFTALRQEAEKNLGNWSATLKTRVDAEKACMDTSLKLSQEEEEALRGLEGVNNTIAQHQKDDAKEKEALEEEKKQKLSKGKAGAFEVQAIKSDPEKDKEKIKRDAKDKAEKKKAQQHLSSATEKSNKAKEDAKTAKEQRIAAEAEVAKFTAEVKVHTEKQAASEKARAELQTYHDLRVKYESDSKHRAEHDAKAKEEARQKMAARTASFGTKQ